MEILRLSNLSKFYTGTGSVAVGLQNIDLAFKPGEFVAVTGESGSGKTTFARVISGMLPFENGEMFIDGNPTSHYTAEEWEAYRRDQISFISQNYGILPGNTVLENVEAALRYYGADKTEAGRKAAEILEQVELSGFETRKASKLSSGQKQRLAIARALAKPSRILVADEPTGNLDRANSDKIISLLSVAARDRLVILITHEFEEAENFATRKIELSDGIVISDLKLEHKQPAQSQKETGIPAPDKLTAKQKRTLSRYTAGLNIRSRPVFSLVLFLTLALTAVMTFVFLGSFIVALDDTPTRIYTPEAFKNGDRDRLVVMRPDKSNFTDEDVAALALVKHVSSVEKHGYICDINYYYREGSDYRLQQTIINGPEWHPVYNPNDVIAVFTPVFNNSVPHYLRTVPYVKGGIRLKAGRLPEDYYEILSADPEYKTGDTVTVYFCDSRFWSVSSYIRLDFHVTGETDHGSGLYFSDEFGRIFDNMMVYMLGSESEADRSYRFSSSPYIYSPYEPDQFQDIKEPPEGMAYVNVSRLIFSTSYLSSIYQSDEFSLDPQKALPLDITTPAGSVHFSVAGTFDTGYLYHVVINRNDYEKLADFGLFNQLSVYISDYAYADRVIDAVRAKGYIVFSPFRLGALEQDKKLATERLVTLGVCLAALTVTALLQLLLLKNMFSSQYFRQFLLLKDIGLTKKVGTGAVIRMFMLFTLSGELLAAAAILILNALNVTRINDIFKYMELPGVLMLFAVHFAAALITLLAILSSLNKNVFASRGSADDLGIRKMEVSVQ